MPRNYLNARSTTGTRTRERDISPTSGMCPICVRDCPILCEIGKSAFRGREVLYPSPEKFGESTQSSNKDYGLDWSHLQILVDVRGARGIEVDPDVALFPNADIKTSVGGIPLRIPVLTAGLGSTKVAKDNWDGLAVGAAISGTIQTIGENVCGMDPELELDEDGYVKNSKDLEYRVNKYREFWDGSYGDIVVQTNVEDQNLGVDSYAISKLDVTTIERKWGQGAKAIGGEVRISDLERAKMLKRRGYVVIPDPEDEAVQEAFKSGTFKTFERHSRVGMSEQKSFVEGTEELREKGAKHVFLKTGAYRPTAVAFTMRCASEAKIDAITFDGAGGGTGMSPVPMMQECATPTVYLEAQALKCANLLKEHGKHVPDIIMAGGFISETQIFKSIAMSNFGDEPYVKSIAMARAPITAVMKASYFAELAGNGKLPKNFEREYGSDPDKFFACSADLRERYGADYDKMPLGAIGLYSYYQDRIGVGLQQLMAGARIWDLELISRDDLGSLSERAKDATGIPLMDEVEQDQIERILLE